MQGFLIKCRTTCITVGIYSILTELISSTLHTFLLGCKIFIELYKFKDRGNIDIDMYAQVHV